MMRWSTAGVEAAVSFSAASAEEAWQQGSLTKHLQHGGGPNILLLQPLMPLPAS